MNREAKNLSIIIALEEAAQVVASIWGMAQLPGGLNWWLIPAFFAPDISMLGYVVNTRVGAFCYNLVHHKAIALAVLAAGIFLKADYCTLAGLLLYGHSSFDRMMGYGLKYPDSFAHTHLGYIGKEKHKHATL